MKALFWAFLALLLATFYHRIMHNDDPWLAEQAYWLVHEGQVRSHWFRGMNSWENRLFVFHKGFIYFGAGVQGLFGFSLPASKSVGAIWTAIGGVVLYSYSRQPRFCAHDRWLLLLLYVACGTVIELSFVNRPEPLFATLGFGSFWLLTTRRWAGAGVLAGLAVFTHLGALCYVLAGVGWLLGRRQWRQAIGFGLVASLVSCLYLIDVVLANGWATFLMQLRDDPALSHINGVSDKIRIVLTVYKQFVVNRTTVALTLLVLGTVLLNARSFRHDRQHPAWPVGHYLLWLVASFALTTRSYPPNYVFTFVPFCCVFVVQCVAHARQTNSWVRVSSAFYVLLGLYLLAGALKAVYTIHLNLTTPVLAKRNARMAAIIGQPHGKVLAPLSFFYEQVGQYNVQGIDRFMTDFFYLEPEERFTDAQLFAFAGAEHMVAVITYDGKRFGTPTNDTNTRPLADSLNHLGTYHRVYQDRWNSLYLPDR